MLPEEEALIAHELDEVQYIMEPGLQQLNWKSEGVEEFLKQSSESVGELYRKLTAAHNNLREITNKLKSWGAPMMKRDPKDRKMVNPQDVNDRIAARVNEIKKGSSRLQKLVELNRVLFSDIDAQINYLKMVSKLIIEGLVRIVRASMEHLKNLMGAQHDEPFAASAIQRVDIVKKDDDPLFDDANTQNAEDIKSDYKSDVEANAELKTLVQEVEGIVEESIMEVEELQSQYKAIDFLWVEDVQLTFKKFLKEGPQVQVHLQKTMRQESMANLGSNFFGDKKADEVPDKGAKLDDKEKGWKTGTAAKSGTTAAKGGKKDDKDITEPEVYHLPELADYESEV
ncbi:MAG: hypothetical protein EZS28_019353 [Streblomastix strix]|uniref:Dynein heavy chain n=1 Tax=Streblomastix strix TaxID=222440 RepID=A0A5J4VRE6_9EUKA|nr:MAG: hypothetical protein EZS28_019353 [Streblomastix strix]